jgi:hypothetical protein
VYERRPRSRSLLPGLASLLSRVEGGERRGVISGGDDEAGEERGENGRRGGVITELRAGGVFKRAPPARFEAGPTVAFLGLGGNSWSHLRPKRVGPVDFSRPRPPASTLPPLFYCSPMALHSIFCVGYAAKLAVLRSYMQRQDRVWLGRAILLEKIWHQINSKT